MPSVLADFTGRVAVESEDWDDGVESRVLLNETQLILAVSDDETLTIPLQSVFDVNVGTVPRVFDPLPGEPVTVAYRDGTARAAAVVAADERTAAKFTAVLFKALLNGTPVRIRHPAKVGGRVVESAYRGGLLSLTAEGVNFETEEGPITVPLEGVVDFDRQERPVDGESRPVLVVTHVDDGDALTTVAAAESNRKLSILGRYLRTEYQQVMESLRDLSLSEPETETLTTIYSAGDMDVSLPSVLGKDPETVKRILHSLHQKGLIESGEKGPVLTAKGQIVVNEYLERVNA